jgi:hypothetical protein
MRTLWLKVRSRAAALSRLRTPGEWWLWLRVFLFAASIPPLLYLKFSTLTRLLQFRIGASKLPAARPQQVESVLRCIESAMLVGRPLIRQSCLVRGLTRYYFLRRAGGDVRLCFGAASSHGELTSAPGHCWLEKDGRPFLEERDPRLSFVRIYTLPQPTPAGAARVEASDA